MPSATSDPAAAGAGADAPLIAARDLEKSYRRGPHEVRALRGVSTEIRRGELVFVLGPSGSGKSTLLHLLGALDRPTRGRVLHSGTDISTLDDRALSLFRRRHVGFIFQSFHLIGTLVALDNVLLPAVPEGAGEKERRRARELLERLGLGPRADHRPHELSGGESQRVAIARALLYDPPVILADEPTGELDSKTGAEVFGYLRRAVKEDRKTLVVVTHDDGLIEPGDRVIRFRDGAVVEDTRADGAPPGAQRAAP